MSVTAAYAFDEGSGVVAADAVGTRDVVMSDPGNWDAAGHTNSCFDGAGGIRTVPSHAGLETASRTVMFWARNTVGGPGNEWLVQFYIVALDTAAFGIGWIGGNLFMRGRVGGVNTNLTTPIVDATNWHHFALTYDGTTLRGYRDGVLFDSEALTGTIDSADILRITDNAADLVDDLRFADEALDSATITALMNTPVTEGNPSGGSEAGIVVGVEGAGSKTALGGSEAGIGVGAEGAGSKATSGGSEAGIIVGTEGAGINPDDIEFLPDRLGPLMLDLLDCAENAMNARGTPVGRAHLVAGLDAVWDDCCEADEDTPGGTLWVRVIETYPTAGQGSPYPQRDTSTRSCHPFAWAVQLAVGVVRCTPTVDDNGVAPSPTAISLSALEMTRDRATLETAIRCCFANPVGASDGVEEGKTILFGWVPVGANGGCAGGEWTLYVALRSCACPDTPPMRS